MLLTAVFLPRRYGGTAVQAARRRVRERLLAAGCEHHRGPLVIGPGRRIAQLRDPFGTVVGIEGP
ncbi:VOC family protein [Streptomyces sanglieri]|uniref:VOC family protein n=1 Tax=Streptomyces sanglieri TaxID=193460 RepID=UPI0035241A96